MKRLYVLNHLKSTQNQHTVSQMDNNSDGDILDAQPAIQVIEQSNAADAPKAAAFYQSQFQVEVEEGALTAAPAGELSYFEWDIATNPMEINGGEEDCSEDHVEGADHKENHEPESMDNEDESNGPDQIDDPEESGRDMDNEETHPSFTSNKYCPHKHTCS